MSSLKITHLVGTWSLVDYVRLINGTLHSRPLGDSPAGQISYQADGFMSALLMVRDRPWPTQDAFIDADAEIRAQAARGFSAYAGPFEIEGATVVHHVRVALWLELLGTSLRRTVSWHGRDLVLSTDPARTPSGRLLVDRLHWTPSAGQRAVAAVGK